MQPKPIGRCAGITLIEVIVAVTIAALLTAAGAPAIDRAVDRARADGSIRELVVALKSTRHQARASGADALFSLDVNTRVFRIMGGREDTLAVPQDATLTLLTAESERLDEFAGAIRFFPDGSSTGGAITLVYRGQSEHIEVDWLTGHVRAVSQ